MPSPQFGDNVFRRQINDNISLDNFAQSPGAQGTMDEMRRQAGLALNENLLPQVNSQASMYGALGDSNAALERSRTRTRVGESLNGSIAQLLSNLFGQSTQAIGQQAGQMDQFELGNRQISSSRNVALQQLALQEALGFGEQNRLNALAALQGQQYYDGLQMQQQQVPFSMLQELLGIVNPIASNYGSTHTEGTNVVPGMNTNPIMAGVNGGIGGLMLGNAMYGQPQQGYRGELDPAAQAWARSWADGSWSQPNQ